MSLYSFKLKLRLFHNPLRASFTKQGKLARVQIQNSSDGRGNFLGWFTNNAQIKDATSHLHIDQRNIPSAAQISVVANEEIKK